MTFTKIGPMTSASLHFLEYTKSVCNPIGTVTILCGKVNIKNKPMTFSRRLAK